LIDTGEETLKMSRRRIEPGPGQESVWDYPRPPRLEDSTKHIQVIFNGVVIADTVGARRVLETSHPPVYYIPPTDIRMEYLTRTSRSSFCEWKGEASYYTITVGDKSAPNAAWFYPQPTVAFAAIKDYVAVYPSLMEAAGSPAVSSARSKVSRERGDGEGERLWKTRIKMHLR